ncbi:unnamed protein product [Nesidiocoris tenuis]|uniref:Uncharacterized protein n=1 Tax=Nesidiocoris tenuis TaxID=355587 RepID=A0A6H5HQ07_9HEMI|nr:unnamed protein product [Nesidiocoris tenuis]
MDVSRKNCKRDYSSEDTRCFTCQTKSNLLYLTTYPHSREGSLREKSPCLENGKKSEKQKEPSGCTKCKYYVEFISNLMDGIICDELQESKRQDGVHDCSTRPELDSQQKIKIVQKLYILFSDAQVAALGGRLKRRKPSYCSDDQSSGIISREESCFERDPCKNDDASPGYLEVIPELESQCGSINAKKTGQKTRQFTSKENKVVMKRKSYSPGLLPKLSSPMMDQRRRSSACTSYASRKSKDTSLSGCSCRSRNNSVASSDNRKIRLLSFKNRRSVENDRIQKSRYDPSNKHSSEKGFQNGRYKCPVVLQKSNSPNCGPKNKSTKNTERKARNVRSEPLQKASPYSSTAAHSGYLAFEIEEFSFSTRSHPWCFWSQISTLELNNTKNNSSLIFFLFRFCYFPKRFFTTYLLSPFYAIELCRERMPFLPNFPRNPSVRHPPSTVRRPQPPSTVRSRRPQPLSAFRRPQPPSIVRRPQPPSTVRLFVFGGHQTVGASSNSVLSSVTFLQTIGVPKIIPTPVAMSGTKSPPDPHFLDPSASSPITLSRLMQTRTKLSLFTVLARQSFPLVSAGTLRDSNDEKRSFATQGSPSSSSYCSSRVKTLKVIKAAPLRQRRKRPFSFLALLSFKRKTPPCNNELRQWKGTPNPSPEHFPLFVHCCSGEIVINCDEIDFTVIAPFTPFCSHVISDHRLSEGNRAYRLFKCPSLK